MKFLTHDGLLYFWKKLKNMIGDTSKLSNGTNLVDAVNSCFQSASNGKNLLASTLTGKGITTGSDATYDVISNNINQLTNTSDTTAIAENVLENNSFYDSQGVKINGTMQNNSDITHGDDCVGTGWETQPLYIYQKTGGEIRHVTGWGANGNRNGLAIVPEGGKWSGVGDAYQFIPDNIVASTIGLTADKIANGSTVCGVKGAGGTTINGSIKKYRVSKAGAINTGDFVQWCNEIDANASGNIMEIGSDAQLGSSYSGVFDVKVLQLTKDIFALAYINSTTGSFSSLNTNNYVIVNICTITNGTVNIKSTYSFTDLPYATTVALTKISDNQFYLLIGHSTAAISSRLIKICTVTVSSNNTITNTAFTQLTSTGTADLIRLKFIPYSNNKFLLWYKYGGSAYMEVITKQNNTFTNNISMRQYCSAYDSVEPSLNIINDRYVFLFWNNQSSSGVEFLRYKIIDISETTSTVVKESYIRGTEMCGVWHNVYKLDNYRFLLLYCGVYNSTEAYFLKGTILTVANDYSSITLGSAITLSTKAYSGLRFSSCSFGDRIFVSHMSSESNKYQIYYEIVRVSGNTISVDTEQLINGITCDYNYLLHSELSGDYVINFRSSGSRARMTPVKIGVNVECVRKLTASNKYQLSFTNGDTAIRGIATSGGAVGKTISVACPNV